MMALRFVVGLCHVTLQHILVSFQTDDLVCSSLLSKTPLGGEYAKYTFQEVVERDQRFTIFQVCCEIQSEPE
jgi:hypothetical protein